MKTFFFFLACLFLPIIQSLSSNWGFYAHQKINYLATFTLPYPLSNFFKKHINGLQTMAVLPDERRYMMDEEAPRHFIDLDHYVISDISFTSFEQAKKKHPLDSLTKHGIVVWYIPIAYQKLVRAFREKNEESIIKYAAELGHYVADAHVPLHTTSNYDGQKTGQTGIHSFWESRIPELLDKALEEWLGPATYLPKVQESAWEYVLGSSILVNNLLEKEKELAAKTKSKHKYSFEQKGSSLVKTYSKEYALAYHKLLKHSIEERFSQSVVQVGNLWYSAWIDSGQADLP